MPRNLLSQKRHPTLIGIAYRERRKDLGIPVSSLEKIPSVARMAAIIQVLLG